jgi:hypothetical protein
MEFRRIAQWHRLAKKQQVVLPQHCGAARGQDICGVNFRTRISQQSRARF